MNCPACSNGLTEMSVDPIVVDVCAGGCGGIWFDNYELEKVDEEHEAAGEQLLEIDRDETLTIDHTERRGCPKCDDQVMMRHFFSVKRDVEIDQCPGCGGFWLDGGELSKIRLLYPTEETRREAAAEYFDDVFGDELASMRAESQEKLDRARRITRMFRFICPTYYIPGKQEWGAF